MTELLNATNLWCDITNALIAKYKPMCETDPTQAIAELNAIREVLTRLGYLEEDKYLFYRRNVKTNTYKYHLYADGTVKELNPLTHKKSIKVKAVSFENKSIVLQYDKIINIGRIVNYELFNNFIEITVQFDHSMSRCGDKQLYQYLKQTLKTVK